VKSLVGVVALHVVNTRAEQFVLQEEIVRDPPWVILGLRTSLAAAFEPVVHILRQ